MTFLQPAVLLALPLIALPVIIHLIHQRRFQSVDWAAMRFLLAARAVARGTTRLRRWLVMLVRMAAVAVAILAVARPLSRGWLAAVGGDGQGTAIVVLDRSPSMAERSGLAGESKLQTARRQLAETLETLGTERTLLIDSVSCAPVELKTPRDLLVIPQTEQTAAPADIPRLLQAACRAVADQSAGASTIWMCSDQRVNDWHPDDPAWSAIRDALADFPQTVRLTLLGYPEVAADNLSIHVVDPVLEPRESAWQLTLDIVVRRAGVGPAQRIPIQLELGQTRSTIEIDLVGTEAVLTRHAIPIDTSLLQESGGMETPRGWGRVTLPADSNPADNDFYFTFGVPAVRRTVIVADDQDARRVLELVAGMPPDRQLVATAEAVEPRAVADMPLDDVSLLVWQAVLPEAATAAAVTRYVERGGQVIFMPPAERSAVSFDGLSWGEWVDHAAPIQPASWRAEDGLLASTRSGSALPVGAIVINRHCRIVGEGTPLAVLPDGSPLLLRSVRQPGAGSVYLFATTPARQDSDCAVNGIVLYAMLQRAIDDGVAALGPVRQVAAGTDLAGAAEAWRKIAGPVALSSEAGSHSGIYAGSECLAAVNRPLAEDAVGVVAEQQMADLFTGLRYSRFQQKSGASERIVEEIWRLFLTGILLALIAEGLLCLPTPPRLPSGLHRGSIAA